MNNAIILHAQSPRFRDYLNGFTTQSFKLDDAVDLAWEINEAIRLRYSNGVDTNDDLWGVERASSPGLFHIVNLSAWERRGHFEATIGAELDSLEAEVNGPEPYGPLTKDLLDKYPVPLSNKRAKRALSGRIPMYYLEAKEKELRAELRASHLTIWYYGKRENRGRGTTRRADATHFMIYPDSKKGA